MIALREYQRADLAYFILNHTEYKELQKYCFKAPLGYGKTVLIYACCEFLINKYPDIKIGISLSHSILINQFKQLFTDNNLSVSIVKADRKDEFNHKAQIQIIFDASLNEKNISLIDRLDYLFVDEFHTNRNGVRFENYKKFNIKQTIGFSATPYGLSIPIVSHITHRKLIDLKYLSQVDILLSKKSIYNIEQYRKAENGSYSFNNKEIEEISDNLNQIDYSIEQFINQKLFNKDAKTIWFVSNSEQAEELEKKLFNSGISARSILGDTKKHTVNEIITSYKQGTLLNLFDNTPVTSVITVHKLTTGFNVEDIQVGVFVTPTNSKIKYEQSAGRVSRYADISKYILDFAGNSILFGDFQDDDFNEINKIELQIFFNNKQNDYFYNIQDIRGNSITTLNTLLNKRITLLEPQEAVIRYILYIILTKQYSIEELILNFYGIMYAIYGESYTYTAWNNKEKTTYTKVVKNYFEAWKIEKLIQDFKRLLTLKDINEQYIFYEIIQLSNKITNIKKLEKKYIYNIDVELTPKSIWELVFTPKNIEKDFKNAN